MCVYCIYIYIYIYMYIYTWPAAQWELGYKV